MADPDLIPEGYAEAGASSERRAADYLSGMTDGFAERTVADLRNGIRPRAELLGATG
jgi:dGTP triphosphohydrolase